MALRSYLLAVPLLRRCSARAPATAAGDEAFAKDLKATIALQGLPCDQVVNSKRNGDSDYNASCKDGNRYHIFVDSSGRVLVKKL